MSKIQEQQAKKPETFIRIEIGKETVELPTWKYHSVLDALRWANVERQDAEDIAIWAARRAKKGEEIDLGFVKITIFEGRAGNDEHF